MKAVLALILMFLGAFILSGIGLAAAQPSALPNSITVGYVPIVLSTANTTVLSPPQTMVTINSFSYLVYEASNLQNIEFFYANGTVIPSWLEQGSVLSANSVYWLNIASGIPAKSSLTIFMGFAPKSTNLFNTKNNGEAAYMSSSYGQYDDGSNVFEFYDNFMGNSLSPQWTSSGNVVVNNGLYIYSTNGVDSYIKSVYSNFSPINNSLEIYIQSAQPSATSNYLIVGYNALDSPTSHALFFKSVYPNYRFVSCTDSCTTIATLPLDYAPVIFGMYTGSGGASHGYQTTLGSEANPPQVFSGSGSNYKANSYISLEDRYATGMNLSVSFVRVRSVLVPDQHVPTATFNALYLLNSSLSISGQFGHTTTYGIQGTTNKVTLNGIASHGIEMLVNGNVIGVSHNGTLQYTISSVGIYNITGKDLNFGSSKSVIFQMQKGNPLQYMRLSSFNATYNGTTAGNNLNSVMYKGSPWAGSANISTPGSRPAAILLQNGAQIGSTSNSMQFRIGPSVGHYNYTFYTNGDANWTAGSLSFSYNISKASQVLFVDMRSYNYNGSSETSYANFSDAANQIVGTLYENGTPLSSSSTGSIRFTIGPAISKYNFTLSVPGDANYTPATASYQIQIYPSSNTLVRGVIKHIIIITQENHAFDNYFGTYPGAVGIPANACEPISLTNALKGCVAPYLTTSEPPIDMAHSWNSSHWAWDNGKMDGFVSAPSSPQQYYTVDGNPFVMATYNYQTIPYYWGEAENYTLADNFFSAALSYSLPNHWFEIAANAPAVTMNPNWTTSQLNTPQSQAAYLTEANPIPTLADELLDENISWMYYGRTESPNYSDAVSDGDAFDYWEPLSSQNRSYTAQYLPHFAYFNTIFNSISNGTLASVSWIVPNINLSEHAPANIIQGMWYTTDIVDSVENSSYWNSTLIVITWDEYGGYYDSVAPPIVNGQPLGFRVPAIIISPYSKTDFIDNSSSSFMSTMKFIEWNWNLPAINGLDNNSSNLLNAFYYNQTAGPNKPHIMQLTPSELQTVQKEMEVVGNCLLCNPLILSNSTPSYNAPYLPTPVRLDEENSTIDVNGYILPASWFVT